MFVKETVVDRSFAMRVVDMFSEVPLAGDIADHYSGAPAA